MTERGGTMPEPAEQVGAVGSQSMRGQTMAEYSVVLALICLAAIAAYGFFFNSVLQGTVDRVTTILTGV
jgi:Flp pilus assembly pilin Flp